MTPPGGTKEHKAHSTDYSTGLTFCSVYTLQIKKAQGSSDSVTRNTQSGIGTNNYPRSFKKATKS
jgi:hypothetical protein